MLHIVIALLIWSLFTKVFLFLNQVDFFSYQIILQEIRGLLTSKSSFSQKAAYFED